MAYLAVSIAAAFIERAAAENTPVSHAKLQHLAYYAHGYHLALYNQPLITQRFEAWKNGPALHSIYLAHKGISRKPLPQLPDINSGNLSPTALHVINLAWQACAKLSTKALAKQTTAHGSPWAIANAPQHRTLYIADAHTQRFFENKCRQENITPLANAYRVMLQDENQALPLQFQPLVCPHCKTAPCAAVQATQPNLVTNTKTIIDFNPLSQAACA